MGLTTEQGIHYWSEIGTGHLYVKVDGLCFTFRDGKYTECENLDYRQMRRYRRVSLWDLDEEYRVLVMRIVISVLSPGSAHSLKVG